MERRVNTEAWRFFLNKQIWDLIKEDVLRLAVLQVHAHRGACLLLRDSCTLRVKLHLTPLTCTTQWCCQGHMWKQYNIHLKISSDEMFLTAVYSVLYLRTMLGYFTSVFPAFVFFFMCFPSLMVGRSAFWCLFPGPCASLLVCPLLCVLSLCRQVFLPPAFFIACILDFGLQLCYSSSLFVFLTCLPLCFVFGSFTVKPNNFTPPIHCINLITIFTSYIAEQDQIYW